jgi:hypothetical protein
LKDPVQPGLQKKHAHATPAARYKRLIRPAHDVPTSLPPPADEE